MRRQPVAAPTRSFSRPYTFVAPTGGWVTAENLANSPKATAQVLDNWFPTTTGIRLRGGSVTMATIGADVKSMLAYNKGTIRRLFAATSVNVYDVTAVSDPTVVPSPVVTGQTSGAYSYINFTTSGGPYLAAVNGTDPLLLYDGAAWSKITGSSTPIAITGVSTSALSFIWTHRNRAWAIQKGTLNAWYLPVDSLGGAASKFVLDGVLDRGGSLLFGATWSQSGTDDLHSYIVFVSDQGQAAVYSGTNPATDFEIVGVYEITPPMGPRATMKAGGDLLIATEEGLVPLSMAVQRDPAALALAMVSRPIEPNWRAEADRRRLRAWDIVKWPQRSCAIVSLPRTSLEQEPWCFVVNTQTGAWCRYVGWDATCFETLNGNVFFGTSDGKIKLAEVGGSDDGALVYYTYVGNPDPLGVPGQMKTLRQARTTFRSASPYLHKISFSTNYEVVVPSPPNAVPPRSTSRWDIGLWDVALWDDATPEPVVKASWSSVGRTGYVFQPQVQITGGLGEQPNTEFVQMDCMFETGGIVV